MNYKIKFKSINLFVFRFFLVCSVLVFFNMESLSQINVNGILKNKKNNEVISYGNIGIFKKGIGTISNENGQFNLTIPKEYNNDSLSFSCIGFHPKRIDINSLSENGIVYLSEKSYDLDSVTVMPSRTEKVGREKTNGIVVLFERKDEDKNLTGGEIGMFYRNKQKIRLKELKFLLARNTYDTLIIRVNVYNSKKTGVRHKLNCSNCIIPIHNKETGWIKTNLENDNIILDQHFFVALEILKVSPNKGRFGLVGGFKPIGRERSRVRDVSFDSWNKKPFNLSIITKVEYVEEIN